MAAEVATTLPNNLDMPIIHDRAVEVARGLSGLRVSDAIDILENAKECLLRASVVTTDLIPPRNGEDQTAL